MCGQLGLSEFLQKWSEKREYEAGKVSAKKKGGKENRNITVSLSPTYVDWKVMNK